MEFRIGDRVVRKRGTVDFQVCQGTIESISGENITVKWGGKWNNVKKSVKASDILPISEIEQVKSKILKSKRNKEVKDIAKTIDAFTLTKLEDGFCYAWHKLPLMPCELQKLFPDSYQEKRHPEKGYIEAVRF